MNPADQPVVITDIRIPFWRLVAFIIKSTLAAIPATILIVLLFMVISFIIGLIFHVDFSSMMNR